MSATSHVRPACRASPRLRFRLLGPAALALAALGASSGCRALAWAAMDAGNAIACLGAYQRTADLAYGPAARDKLDVYRPVGRYLAQNPDPQRRRRKAGGVRRPAGAARLEKVSATHDRAAAPRRRALPRGRPVVVFFHGGDWSRGYPGKSVHRFVGDALTSRGFVAVIVNYRRYPGVRFPAFIDDGARAVAWTHKHIAEYGGDPGRIFVMGHSAGAHIAAMLATDGAYLRRLGASPRWIKGMIGMAGPYSFLPIPPGHPLLEKVFGPPARYPLSQPVNYVDARDPPMLLLRGAGDRRVPAACMNRMMARVGRVGGWAQAITYPKLSHIMLLGSLATPVRWNHPVLDDIAAFIGRVDARPPPAGGNDPGAFAQAPPPPTGIASRPAGGSVSPPVPASASASARVSDANAGNQSNG